MAKDRVPTELEIWEFDFGLSSPEKVWEFVLKILGILFSY